MKFKIAYKGKSRIVNSAEDALAYLATTGVPDEVILSIGEWAARLPQNDEDTFSCDWPKYDLHIENYRDLASQPPEPETEFIILIKDKKLGWRLYDLAGKSEAEAYEVLAMLQAHDPFGQYRVEEPAKRPISCKNKKS